jgi:hypothetical protein
MDVDIEVEAAPAAAEAAGAAAPWKDGIWPIEAPPAAPAYAGGACGTDDAGPPPLTVTMVVLPSSHTVNAWSCLSCSRNLPLLVLLSWEMGP